LFAKIGYTYGGAGNDFRLPDLRGEFLRGWDDGRNIDAGRTIGSSQRGSQILSDDGNNVIGLSQQTSNQSLSRGSNYQHTSATWDNYDGLGSAAHTLAASYQPYGYNNYYSAATEPNYFYHARPRNVAMMACIKAFGDIDNPDLINATAVLENINNKVDKRGDTMTGRLTLSADPTFALHAATKQYVDVVASNQFTITYGNEQYSTSGFSNTATRGFDETRNYFDVYPPAGKTMSNLAGFIPSIAYINFAGDVDNNDQLRCRWLNLGDRIRVQVQNTEQSLAPAANWIAFWR
jgi:hypothetical protein